MIAPSELTGVRQASDLLGLLRRLDWPLEGDSSVDFFDEPELVRELRGSRARVRSLVQGAGGEDWIILLVEFQERFLRRDLRRLLAGIRRNGLVTDRFEGKTKALFIVTTPAADGGYGEVRFVRFADRPSGAPEIRSFGWTRESVGRTVATTNLPALRWGNLPSWEAGWDVEGLTERFYDEYAERFRRVAALAYHPGDNSAGRREDQPSWMFVQQLFNRLLFTEFVDRMDWLTAPAGVERAHGYLTALWMRHRQLGGDYSSFGLGPLTPTSFIGLLGLLFHRGFDSEGGVGPQHILRPLLGRVEYLNGGLFTTDPELEVSGATVPDEAFGLILDPPEGAERGGLFRRFNFTVTESTPLDQEVAVDPEMLGKVFERLVNDRHQEGKYYTPRPIVSFMVDEALKGYLIEGGLDAEKAALLIDQESTGSFGDAVHIAESEVDGIVARLRAVRAVDPACGSGAYLLGLLQRLFDTLYLLRWRRSAEDSSERNFLYKRKLELLQNCIFGVDLDPTAVRIARLRLWLSLTVENKHGERPEPLPHLDFRIEEGDSLAVPIAPTVLDADLIREYAQKKREFGTQHGADRDALKVEIDALKAEIQRAYGVDLPTERPTQPALAAAYDEKVARLAKLRPLAAASEKPFDWVVEFAEVLSHDVSAESARPSGFDIVVANPPYVRADSLGGIKQALRVAYPDVAHGKADLYAYFFERAVELLRTAGRLVFVTPNRFFQAQYGQGLRTFLRRSCPPSMLVDFQDKDVFPGIATYPLITFAQKLVRPPLVGYAVISKPLHENPDVRAIVASTLETRALPQDEGEIWNFLGEPRDASRSETLGYITGGGPWLGLKTGLNEAFFLSEQQLTEFPAAYVRPLIRGKDVTRWRGFERRGYILYAHELDSLQGLPALHEHFERFRPAIDERQNRGRDYWQFRPSRMYESFRGPKIVFPDISRDSRFSLVVEDAVVDTSCFFIPRDDLYLLGVLNSRPTLKMFAGMGVLMQGGYYRFNKRFSENIPIPVASVADRLAVEHLVQDLLSALDDGRSNVSDFEDEIDRRVAFLYAGDAANQSFDEVKVAKSNAVRALLRYGRETPTLEFKETFAGGLAQSRDVDHLKEASWIAICAFLNADGGDLLIGVDNHGRVAGLEGDLARSVTIDALVRKVESAFGAKLTPNPIGLVSIEPVEIDGQTILHIHVKPDRSQIYHFDNQIFVRRNAASKPALSAAEIAAWSPRRQRGDA